MQDIVTRYASQTGHHVVRRFGWDCHGLPVEYEIDKKLGTPLVLLVLARPHLLCNQHLICIKLVLLCNKITLYY